MNTQVVASSEFLLQYLGVDLPTHIADLAFTHRSYAYEHGGIADNERLEFLGDSVLGFVVTKEIFHTYPEFAEGRLAKMRAAVVSTNSLAKIARQYQIGSQIRLGKGEQLTGGADKTSILADTLEAIFGAVFQVHGIQTAQQLILRLVGPAISDAAVLGAGLDWKTSLQELTSRLELGVPRYQIAAQGPDHAKAFTAQVWLGERAWGTGQGSSKKVAEQQAAQLSYQNLIQAHPQHDQQDPNQDA